MPDSRLLKRLVNTPSKACLELLGSALLNRSARYGPMTFTQLRTLVAIARCGSVKAAALELKVSQAAVSQAISGLRSEFDDELYVRDGGGVRLTVRGRQVAGAGAEILGLAEHAKRTGSDAQGAA